MFDHSDRNQKLLKHRVIGLHRELVRESANLVISKLLYLQDQARESPIHLMIDSAGGRISDGLAIVDAMNEIDPPIYTYGLGLVGGPAALILANGQVGFRYIRNSAYLALGKVSLDSLEDVKKRETYHAIRLSHNTSQCEPGRVMRKFKEI